MSNTPVPKNLATLQASRAPEARVVVGANEGGASGYGVDRPERATDANAVDGLVTPASIAQDELILARSDLKTALGALSSREKFLLNKIHVRIRTIRRATRFCSVVPVLIPLVWLVLTPRLRRMWQELREIDESPRIVALQREIDDATAELREKTSDESEPARGVMARSELRWLLRAATFAPPAFMVAIAIAIHYAVF